MSKYDYGCKVVCNANDVFPAMRDLVEKEGLSVHDAALFIEKDSGKKVSKSRAYQVYTRRVKERKVKKEDPQVLGGLSKIERWDTPTDNCLKFAVKLLKGKVAWKTEKERVIVKGRFDQLRKVFELYAEKVNAKMTPFG